MPKEFRICVGAPGRPRSTIWKFHAQKADVYITSRMFGCDGKVSFHASGNCHAALTDAWATRTKSRNQDKFFARWHQPRPNGTEAPLLYEIRIARSELAIVKPEEPRLERVHWIDSPELGHAVVLACYITPPRPDFAEPPNMLGRLPLADGRHFVVTHCTVPVPSNYEEWRELALAAARQQGLQVKPGYRLSLGTERPRGLIEMAVAPSL